MALRPVAVAGLSAVALACQPLPSPPAASPPPPAANRVEATPATPLKLVNGQITMRPDGSGLAVFEWDLSRGGGIYLYATSDAGAHWARVEAVPRGDLLFWQPLDDGGFVVGWAPLPGRVPRLYGSDWNWNALPFGNISFAAGVRAFASFVDSDHGWVGLGREGLSLWRTDDGGAGWTRLPDLASVSVNGLAFQDQDHGWVSLYNGSGASEPPRLLSTADGGRSWRLISLREPERYPGNFAALSPVTVWAGAAATSLSVYEGSMLVGAPESVYVYAAPHGDDWSAPRKVWSGLTVQTGAPVIQAAGPAWWLLADGGLAVSLDDGRSWSRHALPLPEGFRAVRMVAISPMRTIVVAEATSECHLACQRVLRTDDAGATWVPVSSPDRY